MRPAIPDTALSAGVLALALASATPALAERPALAGEQRSAHISVHYDPAKTAASEAQSIAADAEEAYGQLVAGTGVPHNAGLRAPIDDGDGNGRVDVYVAVPASMPGASGGFTFRDTSAPYGSYYFLTPDLSRSAARFRAAHELMHVIQQAYQPNPASPIGGLWSESTANWAAEWSLPEVDPLDNNFRDDASAPAPWLPLDCSYGKWPASVGRPCGDGYWQWLFIERQVEDYGVDFVHGLLERVRTCNPDCSTTAATDRAYLNGEISAQSGGSATLAGRYASYAWQVWDPTAWTTSAVAAMHARSYIGRPAAATWTRGGLVSGYYGGSIAIDHLGTRYVLVRNVGDEAPSGPADTLSYTVGRPVGMPVSATYLTRAPGQTGWTTHVASDIGIAAFDPATTRELLLPLANASTSDAQSFNYAARLNRGTPTPPANDGSAGALPATLDTTAQTDSVYAGGRGDLEATGCTLPGMADVRNGVWFTFTAPNAGQYWFDVSASTMAAVLSLHDQTMAFGGCSSNGRLGVTLAKGAVRRVFVGRLAGDSRDGTLARLLVTGPPSNTAVPAIAGTARAGELLTLASAGGWTGTPSAYTRQWQRCSAAGSACAPIAGATAPTYRLVTADVGARIAVAVTATNGYGSGSATSVTTAVVEAAPVTSPGGGGTPAGSTSTPSTSTSTPSLPGAMPARNATVTGTRSLRVDRRGLLKLKLRCAPGADACPGTFSLGARVSTRAVRLGSGRFVLAGGTTQTVAVRLSAANRRLLLRLRRIAATLTIRVTQADGTKGVVSVRLTLRSAP